MRVWLLVVLAVCGLRCSSFRADGEGCPASVCSDHGVCTYQATFPTCACEAGYDGVVCSRCAVGFHRAADDSCVIDETCTPGSCGAGVCAIDQGRAVCTCLIGFTGAGCETCRAGYHAVEDGGCALDQTCTPTSCTDAGTCSEASGRVQCSCPEGRAGAFCEQFAETCAMRDPCVSGRCVESSGQVRCVCPPGVAGPACDRCAVGFRESDAGCVSAEGCHPSRCSFAGVCVIDGGLAGCACDPGYAGDTCGACAAGFHRSTDFACVADEVCGADTCSGRGTCAVEGGVARCACGSGFAGVRCETCAPGFHLEGGDGGTAATCELDTQCRPETCRFHGACADDGGVARCACAPGFSGAFCETNIDDCVNNACNRGTCVDLITTNVCLCDGGVYGQVCP